MCYTRAAWRGKVARLGSCEKGPDALASFAWCTNHYVTAQPFRASMLAFGLYLRVSVEPIGHGSDIFTPCCQQCRTAVLRAACAGQGRLVVI